MGVKRERQTDYYYTDNPITCLIYAVIRQAQRDYFQPRKRGENDGAEKFLKTDAVILIELSGAGECPNLLSRDRFFSKSNRLNSL